MVDFARTAVYSRNKQLIDNLENKPDVAVRRRTLVHQGWEIGSAAVAALVAKKKTAVDARDIRPKILPSSQLTQALFNGQLQIVFRTTAGDEGRGPLVEDPTQTVTRYSLSGNGFAGSCTITTIPTPPSIATSIVRIMCRMQTAFLSIRAP